MNGCSTTQIAPPSIAEALSGSVSTPYRISSSGNFLIDISVNDQPPRPFVVDTAATVSTIYENNAASLGLSSTGRSVLVQGFITIGERPTVENVSFGISNQTLQLDRIALLETPEDRLEEIGLLGADVLNDYAVVFDKETLTATFIPNDTVNPKVFSGWRKIDLSGQFSSYKDEGLHFAEIDLGDKKIPVLIDTGSNLNIINWKLATLDKEMLRLQQKVRNMQLHGVIDSAPLRVETFYHDLTLGNHYWPLLNVLIMDFDAFLPVNQPVMIAGAEIFTSRTVAFDLSGDAIYIRPEPDDPRPPKIKPRF